jgi:YbgC/YbaW family acyl-CoA thioester hydrolase
MSNRPSTYLFELEARGYELDSYGHVNNSVYFNYTEQARWDVFRQLGLYEMLASKGLKIVLVENQMKYIRQVRLFDKIKVETIMEKSAHFLLFRHALRIAETGKPVAKSTAKTVFLDQTDKPCDIPKEILDTLEID